MRTRILGAAALVVLLPALALAWPEAPPPADQVTVTLPDGSLTLWPYTGTSFDGTGSDPVNLLFLNVDPRAIRQALMALPPAPPLYCTWADAMGYEQTAWAETEGWVGSEIQLACIHPGEPLGDPFRIHLRLFRQGPHTVGAAHFEILLPETAEHQVLSWDYAELLVAGDIVRTEAATGVLDVALRSEASFRAISPLVYNELVKAGLGPLLEQLGLPPGQVAAEVPIPTLIPAKAMAVDLVYEPMPERIRTRYASEYDVVAPKPFCNPTGSEYVKLKGRLRFDLRVYGDEAGRFLRKYDVKGQLTVTPWHPIAGVPLGHRVPARIRERHAAVLTDGYGQVYEKASQQLLGTNKQSLSWFLAAGELDRYFASQQCGP